MWRKRLTLVLVATLLLSGNLPQATLADVVYCTNCGTEWTQLASQAEAIQQTANQLRQIQQQLQQYQTMLQNTATLPEQAFSNTFNAIREVTAVYESGKALAATAANLDEQFARRYTTYRGQKLSQKDWENKYQQWSQEANANTLNTLRSVGLQHHQLQDEEQIIKRLQSLSRSSSGRMQALQVANQMAAESLRQTQKLRQLMMLQLQMQANYLAQEEDRRALSEASWRRFANGRKLPNQGGPRY